MALGLILSMPFKLPVRLRKEGVEGYPVGMYVGMEIEARIGSDSVESGRIEENVGIVGKFRRIFGKLVVDWDLVTQILPPLRQTAPESTPVWVGSVYSVRSHFSCCQHPDRSRAGEPS